MLLYILFRKASEDDTDMPWVVEATDEYSIDECNGFPEGYAKERAKPLTKEILVDVSDSAIEALFESPVVNGKVVKSDE